MIIKMTNRNKKFYLYMGKFFGSRSIEKQINDRIYDDDTKQWYIYIKEEQVMAFVSVKKNVIKNIYTTEEKYLEEILIKIQKEKDITYSNVTNYYKEIYEKSGFRVDKRQIHKNYITIYMEKQPAIE